METDELYKILDLAFFGAVGAVLLSHLLYEYFSFEKYWLLRAVSISAPLAQSTFAVSSAALLSLIFFSEITGKEFNFVSIGSDFFDPLVIFLSKLISVNAGVVLVHLKVVASFSISLICLYISSRLDSYIGVDRLRVLSFFVVLFQTILVVTLTTSSYILAYGIVPSAVGSLIVGG